MPVFDFTNAPEDKKQAECTYEVFRSNEKVPTAERPILLLENKKRAWKHHSCGVFTNPSKRTSFEFQEEDGTVSAESKLLLNSLLLGLESVRDSCQTGRKKNQFIRIVTEEV